MMHLKFPSTMMHGGHYLLMDRTPHLEYGHPFLSSAAIMDLDKLFTVTDYETRIISIPTCRHDDAEVDVLAEREEGGDNQAAATTTTIAKRPRFNIEIEIVCSPSASTDYDLTGQILWPVSVLLAHYVALASSSSSTSSSSPLCRSTATATGRKQQLVLRDRNVVELGAGTGLPGLVAAACGARRVILTDGNDIVCDTILNRNIDKFKQKLRRDGHQQQQRQEEQQPVVSCQQVVWGNRNHIGPLLKQLDNRVDVVLAADVVQWPAVVEPLLHTVKALLWNAHDKHHQQEQQQQELEQPQTPIFLLGIVNRARATYDLFFQLAQELGFDYRPIRPEEYLLPILGDMSLPDSCREFGGRETEIYELKLLKRHLPSKDEGSGEPVQKQPQQLEPPVLLQPRRRQGSGKEEDDDDDDYSETVGKSFENTAFLPC
jgi:Lysine methyltransferase